ncbi:nicotinamide mononucleotide deamidase-related protein [Thermoplasma sp.]|uniref:nicotinamide mononucleotide deamidase-related protein n=1 Tax=Thermoplasma sp. TaxID=1973142 RepID=UPI00126F5E3A|nr:nicotinamide mononucleotide deamidase-related protein [Thermoplasma sp.]KAA8923428.1 MAG: nicotinamide mononucleotide deamidase-related protein [Thermoplasma sp.]
MKTASIITVGNEILKGRTVNTNAAFIGNFLTYHGYQVKRGIIVMDELDEIGWAFRTALDVSDIVVSSGGLGPTFDDMTVEGFARCTGQNLVINEDALSMIRKKYSTSDLTEQRLKMAKMPQTCRPVENPVGTAPGLLCNMEGKKVIILPGVPKEMQALLEAMEDEIRLPDMHYYDESVIISGVMESVFAPYVDRIMKEFDGIYVKSHPRNVEVKNPELEIEISGFGEDEAALKKKIRDAISRAGEYAVKLGGTVKR